VFPPLKVAVAQVLRLALGVWLALLSLSLGQPPAAHGAPDSSGLDGTAGDAGASGGDPGKRGSGASREVAAGISANPGAVNIVTGTGLLGRLMGLAADSGVRLGGIWIGNADYLFSGGVHPRTWSFNSLLLVDLNLDAGKLIGIPGGELGAEFLRFDGQPANDEAGAVVGYDGLIGPEPLNRTELHELWWRQRLFADKLVIRVGKTIPPYDFNNVSRPIPVTDTSLFIPSLTGLIYTPAFKNPTLIGAMPGYPNSAYGITTTYAPTKSLYVSYALYDGALANGVQTGLREGPVFDGHYFHIGETGYAWTLGSRQLPGLLAVGGWAQTGKLSGGGATEDGAQGFYTFGSRRLWGRHPGVANTGRSGLFQLGLHASRTPTAEKY